ncbi:tautomerase family protein [candidate division KSB1 bacterium]
MPIITFEGPPVKDLNKKREAASKVASAASELYNLDIKTIVIIFKENTAENVAPGGKLLIDR